MRNLGKKLLATAMSAMCIMGSTTFIAAETAVAYDKSKYEGVEVYQISNWYWREIDKNTCAIVGVVFHEEVNPVTVIPSEIDFHKVVELDNNIFYDCDNLTTVRIPNTVKKIGDWAFTGTNITEITFPESVGYIGVNALAGCDSLERIVVMNRGCELREQQFLTPFLGASTEPKRLVGYRDTMFNRVADDYISKLKTFHEQGKYTNLNPTFTAIDENIGMAPDGRLYCDINGDGVVDVIDAQSALMIYVRGLAQLPTGIENTIDTISGTTYYDANFDSEASVADAQQILQWYVAGLAQLKGEKYTPKASDKRVDQFTNEQLIYLYVPFEQ